MAVKQTTVRKNSAKSNPAKLSSVAGSSHNASNLDKLIHERTRLAIVSALAANKTLTFRDLKSILQVSDGNLSTHARKLEESHYINCSKEFDGRLPRTQYSLTSTGRKALKKYIAHMESLIHAMKDH